MYNDINIVQIHVYVCMIVYTTVTALYTYALHSSAHANKQLGIFQCIH